MLKRNKQRYDNFHGRQRYQTGRQVLLKGITFPPFYNEMKFIQNFLSLESSVGAVVNINCTFKMF